MKFLGIQRNKGIIALCGTGGFQGWNWNWWVSRFELKLVAWIETSNLNWNCWVPKLVGMNINWWAWIENAEWWAWIETGGFQGFNWNWRSQVNRNIYVPHATYRCWPCLWGIWICNHISKFLFSFLKFWFFYNFCRFSHSRIEPRILKIVFFLFVIW